MTIVGPIALMKRHGYTEYVELSRKSWEETSGYQNEIEEIRYAVLDKVGTPHRVTYTRTKSFAPRSGGDDDSLSSVGEPSISQAEWAALTPKQTI